MFLSYCVHEIIFATRVLTYDLTDLEHLKESQQSGQLGREMTAEQRASFNNEQAVQLQQLKQETQRLTDEGFWDNEAALQDSEQTQQSHDDPLAVAASQSTLFTDNSDPQYHTIPMQPGSTNSNSGKSSS